jgi:hypothetical protein
MIGAPATARASPAATDRISDHPTGAIANSPSTNIASTEPDISSIPVRVAPEAGADHCQPIVSCDHNATPDTANTASEQASAARPARSCRSGSSGVPARPTACARASNPLNTTSADLRADRGRSENSSSSRAANSSPYRARHARG